MLKTVEYIKENGLNNLLEEFNLKAVDYDHKVLIKYNQIESDFSKEIVQECRGLILEKDTWGVMSYPFKKFFNIQEGHAPEINWNTANVLEKVDGTFIHLYYDWVKKEWICATTGTAEADGSVNNRIEFTFKELFWETINNKYPDFDTENLNEGWVYMFELTSPYNTVVKQHSEPALTLLGVRYLGSLKEMPYGRLCIEAMCIGIPVVKLFSLRPNNVEELTQTFDGMPYSEEGYVVLDRNMNRVKVKNPAYVAVHHLKDRLNSWNIMEIIKTNEVEEFNATFPERKGEVLGLKTRFDALIELLEETWGSLSLIKPKNYDDRTSVKTYAGRVKKVVDNNERLKMFRGLFFNLANGKVDSIREYVNDVHNRKLYYELKSEKWKSI
jgi:hypothetical protein